MKYAALGCLMLLGSAGASAQSVEVGTGDWTDLPWVYQEGHFRMTAAMVDRVHEIARQGTCTVPGMTARRLDLTVPVIIQFGAGNSVERLVVKNMGCPQLESIIGGVALQLAQRGDYRPSGENEAGWYRTEISFLSR
jgi:hypothetical protein